MLDDGRASGTESGCQRVQTARASGGYHLRPAGEGGREAKRRHPGARQTDEDRNIWRRCWSRLQSGPHVQANRGCGAATGVACRAVQPVENGVFVAESQRCTKVTAARRSDQRAQCDRALA
jgi:hypothetical protein